MSGNITAWLIWLPFSLSACAGIVAAVARRKKLDTTMGLPMWDFSRSWASNITIAGTLVTLSALTFLPSDKQTVFMPRVAYGVLNFAFPLLAALAPLVYNFSRSLRVTRNGGVADITAEGKARMFIVASVLTMWAATGQLELQILTLGELGRTDLLPSYFAWLLAVVIGLTAVGLLAYGCRTVIDTIDIQPDRQSVPAANKELAMGETQVRRWALL